MLIDSHCHLTYPDFKEDLQETLARAKRAGVEALMTICTRMDEFEAIVDLIETCPELYGTVGVHPHDAEEHAELMAALLVEKAASHPKILAFGECGLDYFYEHSKPAVQQSVLRAHIQAGKEGNKPLVIHARDAEDDMLALFDEMDISNNREGKSPGVIHCFTGTKDFAYACLDRGFYISISGIVTFKKSTELQDIVKSLPLDRLLVETDAPYLAPVPNRGKRNEPAFVVHTANCVAELKGVQASRVAGITTSNFRDLFLPN